MKRILSIASIFIFCTVSGNAVGFLPQVNPVPGGIAVVPLVKSATEKPIAYFGRQPLLVINEDNVWYAIVGLDLRQVPGQYIVKFSAPSLRETTRPFYVDTGTSRLRGHQEPRPEPGEAKPDTDPDAGLFQNLANQWSKTEDIDLPLQNPVTGIEGTLDVDNGYFGLVYHIPAGTEVRAPAAGKVVTIHSLEHTGLTLAIDHGQGLISLLCHLNQVSTKMDQLVSKSEVIALSESSVSIHQAQLVWIVLLNGNMISPSSLMVNTKLNQ